MEVLLQKLRGALFSTNMIVIAGKCSNCYLKAKTDFYIFLFSGFNVGRQIFTPKTRIVKYILCCSYSKRCHTIYSSTLFAVEWIKSCKDENTTGWGEPIPKRALGGSADTR